MQRRIIGILGATGCGKSTLLRSILDDFDRAIVILPDADPALDDYGILATTLTQAAELTKGETWRVRFIVEHPLSFEFLALLAWERQSCVFAVDELQEFCPKSHLSIPPTFKRLILRGRHRGVHLIGCSQRPANVHNDFLSQCASSEMYVFRLVEPSDLQRLSKIISNVERVQLFKVCDFIKWPLDGGETLLPLVQPA